MNRFCLSRLSLVAASALCAASALAQLKPPEGVMGLPPGAPLAAPSAPSAPPQQDPMTPEFRDCVKKSKEAMEAKKQDDFPAVLACLSAEVKRQEGRISGAVGRLGKSLSAPEKTALDAANAAWRRFRDANCTFLADPKAPMPGPLEHTDCLLGMTVTRGMEMDQLGQAAARRGPQRADAPGKK